MSSQHPIAPDVNFVPLGTLTVYAVTEGELQDIKKGSPDSWLLASSTACASLCVPTALSILALDPKLPLYVHFIYWTVAVLTGIVAIAFSLRWLYCRNKTHTAIQRIMNRKQAVGVQSEDSLLQPAMVAPEVPKLG
jgi:hypothetical protein